MPWKLCYPVGGWQNPTEKYESQLGWWNSQYMEKYKMFRTTNQIWIDMEPFWAYNLQRFAKPVCRNIINSIQGVQVGSIHAILSIAQWFKGDHRANDLWSWWLLGGPKIWKMPELSLLFSTQPEQILSSSDLHRYSIGHYSEFLSDTLFAIHPNILCGILSALYFGSPSGILIGTLSERDVNTYIYIYRYIYSIYICIYVHVLIKRSI